MKRFFKKNSSKKAVKGGEGSSGPPPAPPPQHQPPQPMASLVWFRLRFCPCLVSSCRFVSFVFLGLAPYNFLSSSLPTDVKESVLATLLRSFVAIVHRQSQQHEHQPQPFSEILSSLVPQYLQLLIPWRLNYFLPNRHQNTR